MGETEFSDWVTGKLPKPFPQWVNEKKGKRRCKGKSGCETNAVLTDVAIVASDDARLLDLDKATTDQVVAKMRVLPADNGSKNPDEEMYGLSADSGWYYLVVQPRANGVANWVLLTIDKRGRHAKVKDGVFQRCCDGTKKNDPHCTPSDWSYASFETCGMDHRVYIKMVRDSAHLSPTSVPVQDRVDLFEAFPWTPTGQAWVTCSHGCCIAGPH